MQERIKIYRNYFDRTTHEYKKELFFTCWSKIRQLYGAELYQSIQINFENTIVFEVRYCKKIEELINKKNFVIDFKEKEYEIYQVDFMNYNKKYVKIKCKEIL